MGTYSGQFIKRAVSHLPPVGIIAAKAIPGSEITAQHEHYREDACNVLDSPLKSSQKKRSETFIVADWQLCLSDAARNTKSETLDTLYKSVTHSSQT